MNPGKQKIRPLPKLRIVDNAIMHALAPKPGDNILIIGCNNTNLCSYLTNSLDREAGGKIWGIDVPPGSKQNKKETHQLSDFSHLPIPANDLDFPGNNFDAIISPLFFDSLSLLEQKDAMLEAYRTLKPGGKLIFAALDMQRSVQSILFKCFLRTFWRLRDFDLNPKVAIPGLMIECGFFPPWIIAHYWGAISVYSTEKLMP